ncbi:hypothetical protein JIG36_13060 [Actinoplanes sp. LDG1-06]|uniref:Uncharacterized protein n=1 Tax=Paractinoplanes ovalisporus TaxID=2810368 RepID=A0ABS2A9H7_9ACTN|nr:hypothetical protein [Actinoplanes ovalisporus]MBM2616486.1 hypothetical protein [Actinoplanes ovalisporus]
MIAEELAAASPSERRTLMCRLENTTETIEELRAVRRDGPGRLRRTALEALATLGGEAALEPADRRAVERLVRIRRRTDPIGSVTSCWTYWWTIRGDDQAAVIEALGLTGVRETTYALASVVIDTLEHDKDAPIGLVYVGPSINGWVPLMGPWCDAFGDRAAEVRETIARLSVEFGEAHAFYFGERGDGSAWHIVRDGVVVRTFDSEALETCSGEPLPIEREALERDGLTGRPEDHAEDWWDIPDANEVAAAVSLDVGWHHPKEGVVKGSPVLAYAPGTEPFPLPPAFYEI